MLSQSVIVVVVVVVVAIVVVVARRRHKCNNPPRLPEQVQYLISYLFARACVGAFMI
jgi:heme/copper-type cytochrome/quinol oxidase subunit 2